MDRYKDRDPKKTVERIKGILADLGIHPEGEVMSFADRFFSMRITDPELELGTNGKGATEDLAWASAYGEFMERLQNDFLMTIKSRKSKARGELLENQNDFVFWPDEKIVSFEEAIGACPDVASDMVRSYVAGEYLKKDGSQNPPREEALAFWRNAVGETVPVVPYYCVGTGSCVDLPEDIIRRLCMSNGLASGNTPEEALVEGMSEICERYAKAVILNNELCPPLIPREFIQQNCPVQADMLKAIEARSPELNIIVFDASLGRGLPAVSILFIDQKRGAVRPKFGAHPSIAIALERCMTEQYQGYDPASKSATEEVFTLWDSWSRKSVHFATMSQSAFTADRLIVPDRMLLGCPDWEFVPWGVDAAYTNKRGAKQLASLLRSIGGEVYVRDNGYLGVPAYRIYVPVAASKPTPWGKAMLRDKKHGIAVASAISAYNEGDYLTASSFLKLGNSARHLCAAQELLLREEGVPEDERDVLLAAYFGYGAAAYAKAVWRSDDVESSLQAFKRREAQLMLLGGAPKRERNPHSEARLALLNRLKELKAANRIDQMGLRSVFMT